MPAGTFNIQVEQGSTLSLQLTLRDTANKPVDLTGWAGAGQIKRAFGGAALASFSVTFKEPRLNPDNSPVGILYVTLPPSESWKLTPDPSATSPGSGRLIHNFLYDVVLVKPDNSLVRILQGTVDVSQGITHP